VKTLAIILLIGMLAMAAGANLCRIGQLQAIALTAHDPNIRHQLVLAWLEANVKHCSNNQLLFILNNLAAWMGTADSSEIRSFIYDNFKRDKE
jgi:hypothetical protein